MTNPTSNFGWQMPTSTDLVTDLPADFEVFGQAVDTAMADLKGGTTNQVLAKNSNTDMDFKWVADAAGMTNPMTTTGDTIYSSSGSTPARLGIGTIGQILQVNSGATAPEWATPVSVGSNYVSVASGSLTGSAVNITGLSGYDKYLIMVHNISNVSGGQDLYVRFNNDSTSKYTIVGYNGGGTQNPNANATTNINVALDPARTDMLILLWVDGAKSTSGVKFVNKIAVNGNPVSLESGMGYYDSTSAITQINFVLTGSTFDSGSYKIFGA
jgi:hypothetical protein